MNPGSQNSSLPQSPLDGLTSLLLYLSHFMVSAEFHHNLFSSQLSLVGAVVPLAYERLRLIYLYA